MSIYCRIYILINLNRVMYSQNSIIFKYDFNTDDLFQIILLSSQLAVIKYKSIMNVIIHECSECPKYKEFCFNCYCHFI